LCGRIYFKGSEKEQDDIVDKLLKEIQTEVKALNVIYDLKNEGFSQYCSKDIDVAIDEQIKEIESLFAELQEIQKAGYRVDYIEGILSNRQTLRK
jgi:DNA replication protein DnaD